MRSAFAETRRASESKERPWMDGACGGRQLRKPSYKWVKIVQEKSKVVTCILICSFFLGKEIPAAVKGADGGEEA